MVELVGFLEAKELSHWKLCSYLFDFWRSETSTSSFIVYAWLIYSASRLVLATTLFFILLLGWPFEQMPLGFYFNSVLFYC